MATLNRESLLLFYILSEKSIFQHDFHNLTSSLGNRSTRAEDGYYTSLVQEVVVLCRDYTTGKHEDVFAAELLEFFHQLRNQCFLLLIQ